MTLKKIPSQIFDFSVKEIDKKELFGKSVVVKKPKEDEPNDGFKYDLEKNLEQNEDLNNIVELNDASKKVKNKKKPKSISKSNKYDVIKEYYDDDSPIEENVFTKKKKATAKLQKRLKVSTRRKQLEVYKTLIADEENERIYQIENKKKPIEQQVPNYVKQLIKEHTASSKEIKLEQGVPETLIRAIENFINNL